MMRMITSGESHGKGLIVTIEGVPSNLPINEDFINLELSARQAGYGRGGRMKIERDRAEILSGVKNQKTTGSPITLAVWNKDWENWKDKTPEAIHEPRPGHADLIGAYKYGLLSDIRLVLERSSARETAARVAGGAIAKQMIQFFGMNILSYVVNWGGIEVRPVGLSAERIRAEIAKNDLRAVCDPATANRIIAMIDMAKHEGNTLGGIIETIIDPVLPFLGSYQTPDLKLDSQIARTALSIQAIKGIEFGLGFGYAQIGGKEAHDEIFYSRENKTYHRKTNNAGGIEGGMSNSEPIVFRCVMKPIPTLMSPLKTVNIHTKHPVDAVKERSDVTALPAACVVMENAVSLDIANALIARYGSDNVDLIAQNIKNDHALQEFRIGNGGESVQ